MPRSAVIAVAVIGVLALVASTGFALVRSTQLQTSQQRVAALESELARDRAGDAPTETPAPDNPLGDLFGDGEDNPLGDLFGEGGEDQLGDLLGDDAQQLARCIQPAGQPGSRDVPDGDVTQQITQIGTIVQELRGLRFTQPPAPQFLDDAQVTRRVRETVSEDYTAEDAQLDARLLSALGAVPAGTDLLRLQLDLLTTQIAGFYDPETDELVVRTSDAAEGMTPTSQSTLAHELQHAVADQRLELPIDVTENMEQSDAALAALSLIEGDASLTQQQFTLVGMNLREQLGLSADPGVLDAQRQLEDVPHYFVQSLQFPYLAGLQFVCSQYIAGGWDAVNALYDNLPTTSAEIMDPDRYPTPATNPRDSGAPGADWRRTRTTTVGAADLQWLFEAPADDPTQTLDDPRGRALAWTGGEMTLWTRGDAIAFGVALTQRQADGPLCDSVTTWYQRAFPDSTDAPPRTGERMVRQGTQSAVVACSGTDVRLGIGPDVATARALAS
jgi:type II secretory pathway pseudopilin PulG